MRKSFLYPVQKYCSMENIAKQIFQSTDVTRTVVPCPFRSFNSEIKYFSSIRCLLRCKKVSATLKFNYVNSVSIHNFFIHNFAVIDITDIILELSLISN
jgi:hypothetical protein